MHLADAFIQRGIKKRGTKHLVKEPAGLLDN